MASVLCGLDSANGASTTAIDTVTLRHEEPTASPRNPRFHALLEELRTLHDAKNHDYAQDHDPLSNFRLAAKVGVVPWRGCLVRMSDKWSRVCQLTTGKRPKNESLRDSLIDLSVYALIAILLLEDAERDS